MIIDVIIYASIIILSGFKVLPTWNPLADYLGHIEFVVSSTMVFNDLFPVYTLWQIVYWFLVFEFIRYFLKVVFGLVSLIRGGGNVEV